MDNSLNSVNTCPVNVKKNGERASRVDNSNKPVEESIFREIEPKELLCKPIPPNKELQKALSSISKNGHKIIDGIFKNETGGGHKLESKGGYIGRGQSGLHTFLDIEMVKPKPHISKDEIKGNNWNEILWTGKYGISSKAEYLANFDAQRAVMKDSFVLSERQLKTYGAEELVGNPIIRNGFDTGKKWTWTKLIVVSNLLGSRRAVECASGQESSCKNGPNVDGRDYINFLPENELNFRNHPKRKKR